MAADVRLKHRVEFAAFRAALAGGMRLSDEQAVRVGEALGRLGYPLGIRRTIVERNLRLAFPERDADWIEATARAAYAHLGRETLLMLRLASATREDVIRRTRVANEGPARADFLKGNGVVIVAGHIGNWEIGAAGVAARGYPVDVIAKSAANPLFYERIQAARERLGVSVIDFAVASRHTLRALRAGHVVAFAADQYAGRAGVWVPFFGIPTPVFRGPALMALRTGAPMYLSAALREPDGGYVVSLEPIDTTPTGDMEADIIRITTDFSRRLELLVRAHPEQYLWHHRRWRDEAPDRSGGHAAADAVAGGEHGGGGVEKPEPRADRAV